MNITAAQFVIENDASPVVYGAVYPEGPPDKVKGITVTLANRKTFSLDNKQRRKLPEGYPKWKGVDA